MKLVYVVVVLVICGTLVQDIGAQAQEEAGGGDLREYNQDWPPTPTENEPKRRRVRKRKRRPPVFTSSEVDMIRRRPQRLDEVKEPWEEMGNEATQKTNSRRRLTPVYDATEEVKIRDPFTALQEAEEKQRKSPDLKTLLKQSESLSLSEVLQQKNLSLSELLQGKQEAISALTTMKSIDRHFERSTELSSREVTDAQRKRFSLPYTVDVVTEETTERRVFVPSRVRKLPMTSAKLRKQVTDEPFKMTIDLVEIVTTVQPQSTTTFGTKPKRVTAKEEIFELLKDPVEGVRLSKILHNRNMTVEELVAQRERGSSQVHLADIFHNKTREPEPKDAPLIGHIQTGDSLFVNRKPKTIQVTTPKTTTRLPYSITSFPTYKIETNREIKPFLPLWPSFFTNVYENNHIADQRPFVQPVTSTTEKFDYEDIQRLEEIENALAEAAEQHVAPPSNIYDDDEDEEFIQLPSGVRSAILASLAIVGLSLVVFLTILVIFKWSQRQKRRLNYNGSFSGSKIRSPILESEQRRTFRNFVSETLGKKKNYYKAHLQSMSDSIWDKDEKKSYMI